MNINKRKAFFARLRSTKLLCITCNKVEKVDKYIKSGVVMLECGHERHLSEAREEEWKTNQVSKKLDRE